MSLAKPVPRTALRPARMQFVFRGIVRDHDQKIQIAIRPGITPCLGAEEVDAKRAVEFNQAPRDLFNRLLFRELGFHEPISLCSCETLTSFS